MSKITNIIFNNESHYITSPYGSRPTIKTAAGVTAAFHSGTDYGTDGKKLPQYAIENGSIISCGTANDGAKYIWVKYPGINKKFLHYHLDRICIKSGQSVTKGTLLGYTGKSGKATGVHLHLGVKDLTTDRYEDPEVFAKSYKTPVYQTGAYVVTAGLLRVRTGAGTVYPYRKYNALTANAKAQIKRLNSGTPVNGLVKGCECTVSKVHGSWGKIPSGWICLDYCARRT